MSILKFKLYDKLLVTELHNCVLQLSATFLSAEVFYIDDFRWKSIYNRSLLDFMWVFDCYQPRPRYITYLNLFYRLIKLINLDIC